MDTPTILAHFQSHDRPLVLTRRAGLSWEDATFHRDAHAHDPEGYALLALVPGVLACQRARVLLTLLGAARTPGNWTAARTPGDWTVVDRAVRALMWGTPPEQVVTAFLALRAMRANHKHTTRAFVAFVLEHPEADALIAARRPALTDCFEHALGKVTARGCAWRIRAGDTESDYLRRHLLRFVTDPARAMARVTALYGPGTDGATAPGRPAVPLETESERPAVVTATNRGDIAATLVHRYRGGPRAELDPALARYVRAATAGLPRLDARVALVLDVSASMRGYGEREWAVLSQAVALRLVLEEVCPRLTVIEAGGTQDAPSGATDLASAVLDALAPTSARSAPDEASDRPAPVEASARSAPGEVRDVGPELVVVVTDGYENVLPGDLARVAASLPGAGISTPVLVCQAAYTGGDDLTLRDPAPGLPSRAFWHQEDFARLLPWMFAHCQAGPAWIRDLVLEGGRT